MIDEKIARKYCKEDLSKIKNYDKAIADKTQTWHCHHMTETWWNCTKKDLIDNECYYHRKACELIFLTPAEHHKLHNKGKHRSDETRQKMSEAKKGHIVTEEHRRKISEAMKGHIVTDESRRKMAESRKGKHHTDEARRKISEAAKRRWAANK